MSDIAPTVEEIRAAWEKTGIGASAGEVIGDISAGNEDAWESWNYFIANLPLYIPALLKAATLAPLPWVERPTVTGWWWMRNTETDPIPVWFNSEFPLRYIAHGSAHEIIYAIDARFQGPLAPDETPAAGEGGG